MAITHFKHKGLKQLFAEGKSPKVAPKLQANCLQILDMLDAMTDIRDIVGTKNYHPLKGRKGYHSMHVNGKFTITFAFDDKRNVIDVQLEDYH